jgi:hypothetical protein
MLYTLQYAATRLVVALVERLIYELTPKREATDLWP